MEESWKRNSTSGRGSQDGSVGSIENPMRNSHAVEDSYISDTIKKQWCIVKVWAALEIKMITNVRDPKEVKESIKGNLGTMAVVGALFGSAALGSYMSATGIEDGTKDLMKTIVGSCRVFAAGCGLAGAIMSATNVTLMNTVSTKMVRYWVVENLIILPMPTMLVLGCLGGTGLDVILSSGLVYGKLLQYIVAICYAVMCVFFVLIALKLFCSSPKKPKSHGDDNRV